MATRAVAPPGRYGALDIDAGIVTAFTEKPRGDGGLIGEPVEELKRREFDQAVRSGPRGLTPAAGADPVGGFVSREHVADADDAAVGVADHGESFERKHAGEELGDDGDPDLAADGR